MISLLCLSALAPVLAGAAAGCDSTPYLRVTLHSDDNLTFSSAQVTITQIANPLAVAHATIAPPSPLTLPPDQSFVLQFDPGIAARVTVDVRLEGDAGEVAQKSVTATVASGTTEAFVSFSATVDGGGDGPTDAGPTVAGFEMTTKVTSVAEDEVFSVHLRAHDARGATTTGYVNVPTLSYTTDWGDVEVQRVPLFVNGEADAQFILSRETNSINGPAHIRFSDGTLSGRTPGIKVTAPAWIVGANRVLDHGIGGAFDETAVLTPSWVYLGGEFDVAYVGTGKVVSKNGIGTGDSPDGEGWNRNPSAILGRGAWEQSDLTLPSLALDASGNQFKWVFTYHSVGPAGDSIGMATSAALNQGWVRAASPILPGGVGAQECHQLLGGALLVENPQPTYSFMGFGASGAPCRARSTDGGTTWTDPLPVGGLRAGRYKHIAGFLKTSSVYRLWYVDGSDHGGYATSSDGFDWVDSPSNPTPALQAVTFGGDRYEGLAQSAAPSTGYARASRP